MGKQSKRVSLVELLSFVGIIACAVCLILAQFEIGGAIIGLIGNLCLVAAAVLASWNYVQKCSMTTKIIYYVCVILVIVLYIL